MSFRLVERGWVREIAEGLHADSSVVRVVCPFIKARAAERLLEAGNPSSLQVITRFNLADFGAGVSDTAALRLLMDAGAHIRGVRNLHAKLYVFGSARAIVTSANLTEAGLRSNHEFGLVAEEPTVVAGCVDYFDKLWQRAGATLDFPRLSAWETKLAKYLLEGASPVTPTGLDDEGVEAGIPPAGEVLPAYVGDATQWFVKFFGLGGDRERRSLPVLDQVESSGSHWACTYPRKKRPRQPTDGAIMLMGQMVDDPEDILIYGRAVAIRYQDGRDDATKEEIATRSWKAQWPRYVRVHHPEFIDGALSDGISLNELMQALGSDCFAPTQRNARAGRGDNVNPRLSYRQHAAVELTPEGFAWLNQRLEAAFARFGKISPEVLGKLDWPTVDLNAANN